MAPEFGARAVAAIWNTAENSPNNVEYPQNNADSDRLHAHRLARVESRAYDICGDRRERNDYRWRGSRCLSLLVRKLFHREWISATTGGIHLNLASSLKESIQ
jgi:hypothetical protein